MSGSALAFPTPASLGSLDHYIQAVNRFPLLTAEQETELGRRWREHDDLDAARQLVLSHLRFVVAVSRNYLGYGLPQADLIQEGNIGLMKAVKRFDPERGVRLVSFALHWIRAEIHEYILRNWRLVKVATTKAQRKLFFNLRSMKRSSAALTHDGSGRDRGTELGVKPEEVLEMETRLSGRRRRARPDAGRRGVGHADRVSRPTRTTSRRRSSSACETAANRSEGPAHARWRSWTSAAAGSSKRAGCATTTTRRRCRSWPTSTACPPSASARSKARR